MTPYGKSRVDLHQGPGGFSDPVVDYTNVIGQQESRNADQAVTVFHTEWHIQPVNHLLHACASIVKF